MTVRVGDKLRFGKNATVAATVTRVTSDNIFGDVYVHYSFPWDDHEYTITAKEAEKHLVTSDDIAPGDRVKISDRVTRTIEEVSGTWVYYTDKTFTSIEYARENKVVEPEEQEPFPTGSIVRFKQTRYRVDGFDGEHHDLTPLDDDPEGNLYFSPDFFELVSLPAPEKNSVYYRNNDGTPVLVSHVASHGRSVWVQFSSGDRSEVLLGLFHREFSPQK